MTRRSIKKRAKRAMKAARRLAREFKRNLKEIERWTSSPAKTCNA